jgi:hypothetical protein
VKLFRKNNVWDKHNAGKENSVVRTCLSLPQASFLESFKTNLSRPSGGILSTREEK